MPGKANHRGFGHLRRLPSGRWQASYVGPDTARHTAPTTFQAKQDAEGWLGTENRLITSGAWTSPGRRARAVGPTTFSEYSTTWMLERDLKPRTHAHYRSLLDRLILPTFGDSPVTSITPDQVRTWHAATAGATPTLRAHGYALFRTILNTAVADDLLVANPCRVRGAGQAKRAVKIKPASLEELEVIVASMPERYRLLTLLAAWCGLRFGELTELRRKDIDTKNGVIHVRRGVVRTGGEVIVGGPKSQAGVRDVAIPPHLMPMVREHLGNRIDGGRDGLLFTSSTGAQISPSTLYKSYYPAREKASRPDLRWHDLRHTGAVLAASTGATLAELMARLGHSTPGAALRYQHAAQGRDAEIAAALSDLASNAKT
jgi:integrase